MSDANTNNDMDEKKPMKDELNEADAVNAEVDLDDSKAKFLNGGKGIDDENQCVVEVASDSADVSFTGLGKEELLKYADDPFWKRLRIILFVLFWLGWLAMLVAAIVIIVLAPRCPYRPDLKWYHKESVYRVYAKSFKDSNGDGVGDLAGISSKVSYIESLGAKVISFGSIYKKDGGNGIIDHKEVDPALGTIDDIQAMIQKMKKSGTKIILDFVPNHTSRNHTWFMESRKSKDNKYANFYVWADPVSGGPPNNWQRENGGSKWKLDATRNQYYLCQKGEQYPDLNLRNKEVKKELEGILRFWLDKGIGGFNVVDLKYLSENVNLTNEAQVGDGSQTINQPESMEAIGFFRSIINKYSDKPGRERVLMGVVDADNENMTNSYYGKEGMPGLNIVVDRKFAKKLDASCDAACVRSLVDEAFTGEGDLTSKWHGWMVGDEHMSRISQRLGNSRELTALVLQMMMPGTPLVYYGDEVGMKDGTFDTSQMTLTDDQDELSKLTFRTPMQWNTSMNAGFTYGTPWIPVNDGYKDNNVASENATYRKESVYKKVVNLLHLRNSDDSESIRFGQITTGIIEDMFWFRRQAVGFPGYLVAVNYGSGPIAHRFGGEGMPSRAKVVFHSNLEANNQMLDLATFIELQGGESIILKLEN